MTDRRVWVQRGLVVLTGLVAAVLFLLFPPGVLAAGDQLNVKTSTSYSTSAGSDAASTAIVTFDPLDFTGNGFVVFEFCAPYSTINSAGAVGVVSLFDQVGAGSATQVGRMWINTHASSGQSYGFGCTQTRQNVSNAQHTFSIRAFTTAGTLTLGCGNHGLGATEPCVGRIYHEDGNPGEVLDVNVVNAPDVAVTNNPTVKLSQSSTDSTVKLSQDSTDNAVDINGQPIEVDCSTGCDASAFSESNSDKLTLSAWGVWFLGGLMLIAIMQPLFVRAFRFWELR